MSPCLLMAVTLLPVLVACMYCWLPLSARVGLPAGCQVQMRPSLPVMMARLSLAVILLAFMPSGRLTAAESAVLSARYQACPSVSSRRNPWLRVWAWMMRMPGSCLMRSGSALPVLLVSQVQACPSESRARIRLPEETARTACAFPGRLVAVCSAGFGSWLAW